jgi:hypothetical protein
MQKEKQRQQKQKEQNAVAEIAACKGSRSSRNNIQGQQKRKSSMQG